MQPVRQSHQVTQTYLLADRFDKSNCAKLTGVSVHHAIERAKTLLRFKLTQEFVALSLTRKKGP